MSFDFLDLLNSRLLKKNIVITWIFFSMGMLSYVLFVSIAILSQPRGFMFLVIHDFGMLVCVACICMGYCAVALMTGEEGLPLRDAFRGAVKSWRYVFGLCLAIFFCLSIAVALQNLIAAAGLIGNIGPLIVALLTLPFFIINAGLIFISLCLFSVLPPVLARAHSIKDIAVRIRHIMQDRWPVIFLYTVVSFACLAIVMAALYFITGHAVGITRSVQSGIDAQYPKILNAMSMKSFFSDLALKLPPASRPLGLAGSYKVGSLTYGQWISYIVGGSYAIVFSGLVSFPLAVYFTVSSRFYNGDRD